MHARFSGVLIAFVFVVLFSVSPSRALDLAKARSDGAVVAAALARGDAGDWAGAQAVAARASDPVVRDIVLWRKLRAGAGTPQEYYSFTRRRGTWPGQQQLARAVFGDEMAAKRPEAPLTGAAGRHWQHFRSLWRRDRYDDAEAYLAEITRKGLALGRPGDWADARAALARRAARKGRAQVAYLLASRHHTDPSIGYDYSELEWLAGWVALEKLHKPKMALPHFRRFEASVDTPISLGRGGYWLGRTYEAMGDMVNARHWYRAAAVYQTSFYGQLAAERGRVPGDAKIASVDLPDWAKAPALRSDDVRAGVMLHYAGQEHLAFAMFADLGRSMKGGAELGALARLGLDLGEPHIAVRVAKLAANKGILLYPAYYPVTGLAGYAHAIEPALAMSIARQETELNPQAISPAGARGLMQLMPSTARKVAGWLGEPYSRSRLTDDWQYNARLGQTYLARRIEDFGGSYVLAIAAYNAGINRVQAWISDFGDPRSPRVDVIDWIESIPFDETRNYVQRVMEGLYVYRSRIAGKAGPMTIDADLARGGAE